MKGKQFVSPKKEERKKINQGIKRAKTWRK
jgi:hypothetical protein